MIASVKANRARGMYRGFARAQVSTSSPSPGDRGALRRPSERPWSLHEGALRRPYERQWPLQDGALPRRVLNDNGHCKREPYHAGFPTCEGHFTMELYSGFLNDEGHFTMELYHAGSSTSSTSPCVCACVRGVCAGRAVRYARVCVSSCTCALVAQRCLRPLRWGTCRTSPSEGVGSLTR